MPYERRNHPLVSRAVFLRRVLRHGVLAIGLVVAALSCGTVGYHVLADLPWIDAFYNASMILTGMGPVDRVETTPAKLFASFYALFSGVIFLTAVGVVFAPMLHRLLHHFHVEIGESPRVPTARPTPHEPPVPPSRGG